MNNAGENFLTESGVYALIFKSRKTEAQKFQTWVTDEVLPSIRKNGMYATDNLLDDPDLLLKTVTKLTIERKASSSTNSYRIYPLKTFVPEFST